jgi:hypothetical protein
VTNEKTWCANCELVHELAPCPKCGANKWSDADEELFIRHMVECTSCRGRMKIADLDVGEGGTTMNEEERSHIPPCDGCCWCGTCDCTPTQEDNG